MMKPITNLKINQHNLIEALAPLIEEPKRMQFTAELWSLSRDFAELSRRGRDHD